MAAVNPSGTNTFVPNTEASGNLVADFSRNPKDFALPHYVQYVPSKKNVGLYTEMTVEMAGRILTEDGQEFDWADGADAPTGEGNLEDFEFKGYTTHRKAIPFRMGELTADQADWDILAQHSRHGAQRAMTLRSLRAQSILTNTSNYPSGHTADVTSISGVTGEWDLSTTSRMDIKRCLDHAAETIFKATLGAVKPQDLIVVLNPAVAKAISISQEIRDHIKQSNVARETVVNNLGPVNRYGLPETLYGYKVIVEDAVRVTSRKGATKATSYTLGNGYAMMLSRPGGLEGVEGAPSFSTCTMFFKEEMTVESKHDRDNRRHMGRVVDDYAPVGTAFISGYLFQNPLS